MQFERLHPKVSLTRSIINTNIGIRLPPLSRYLSPIKLNNPIQDIQEVIQIYTLDIYFTDFLGNWILNT